MNVAGPRKDKWWYAALGRRPVWLPYSTTRADKSACVHSAGGAVICQAFVNHGNDFIERAGLQPFLDGDSADQAIDTFDVCGAAEQRTGCGRGFSEAFGCF